MTGSLVFIDQYAGLAGAEWILLSIATAPEIRQKLNVVFALPENGWLTERLEAAGVRVVRFPGSALHYGRKDLGDVLKFAPGFVRQVVWFRRLFQETDAELIYTSSPRYVLQAAWACLGLRTRVVYHVQCLYGGVVRRFVGLALRSHKVVSIVANSSVAEQWSRSLVPLTKHVACLPNWICLEPDNGAREPVDRNLPSAIDGESPFRFAVVGRLAGIKGQDRFLEAAQRLLTEGDDAEFYVVGADHYFEPAYASALRSRYSAQPRVHFLGQVEDMSTLYGRVSCVVVPSREEAFGLVAIEAMYHGVPVIVSDIGELPTIVDQGESGIVVPCDNVEALVTAMRRVMFEPRLRHRLVANARRKVCAEYMREPGVARVRAFLEALSSGTEPDNAARGGE